MSSNSYSLDKKNTLQEKYFSVFFQINSTLRICSYTSNFHIVKHNLNEYYILFSVKLHSETTYFGERQAIWSLTLELIVRLIRSGVYVIFGVSRVCICQQILTRNLIYRFCCTYSSLHKNTHKINNLSFTVKPLLCDNIEIGSHETGGR